MLGLGGLKTGRKLWAGQKWVKELVLSIDTQEFCPFPRGRQLLHQFFSSGK